jgi:hypothetical protein
MTLETTTGASVIAEQVSQILVQPLEAGSVCPRRWPAHLRTQRAAAHPHSDRLNGPVLGCRERTDPDAEVTLGEINLRPLTKSIKALTKFRNEMAPGQLSTAVPPMWSTVVQPGRADWGARTSRYSDW